MIKHSLILLLTTISLIIGGCTITPLAQQPKANRIIGDGEKYWANVPIDTNVRKWYYNLSL